MMKDNHVKGAIDFMTTTTTTMRVPTYLKEFNCIADKCEDTCCVGFTIPIDKYTFEKYQQLQNDDFQAELMKSVTQNPKSTSDLDYGVINATCACPFLENGICGIQRKLGESALSSTCSTYPQHISFIDKQAEKWATLSCPEVSRLVLLNKEGMQFEEREIPVDEKRDFATFQLQTNSHPMTHYFYELRDFTIRTLQDRRVSLDTRMAILRAFYQEMHQLVQTEKIDKLPILLEKFKANAIDLASEDETELDVSVFLDTLIQLNGQFDFVKRYKQTAFETVQGFQGDIHTIGLDFLEAHEYMLENYLVHYVFQKLFPFSYGENIYEAFQMLELHYGLLQVHALGVGSQLGKMDEEIIVRIIQSFVKEADHNSGFLPLLFNRIMK